MNPASFGRPAARRAAVGLFAILVATASTALAETTYTRTIKDTDHDDLLEFAPGETYKVRTDLQDALPDRSERRVARLSFAQFTDTHVVDEESPLRVEFLDRLGPPVNGAYRPQEGLSPQLMSEMVRQVRDAISPVTGQGASLLMMTGDNSDNTQLNEVRWVIGILDGGRIEPNSGVAETCGTTADGHLYDGVRGGGAYYEPDSSSPPGDGVDGDGYAPNRTENENEAHRSNRMRDYPGLYEAMNRPFKSVGVGIPWYSVFGNHDALIQGNQPRNEALEALAVGCVKVTALSQEALGEMLSLAAGGLTPKEVGTTGRIVTDDMLRTVGDPARASTLAETVPSDSQRRPLKKIEYMQTHFSTTGQPVGHGFTSSNLASGQGNYSFSPRNGLRFLVLDSISERGNADGNIDHAQFKWIHQQLTAAESKRELVIAFAHHSLRTMNQPAAGSPFPPGDEGGNDSLLVHFGLGPDGTVAPCLLASPDAAPSIDETLRCLFLRHRNLIAFVDGHEHLNHIAAYPRTTEGAPDGGFWEVTTASHIDWPQQSRLLDLVNNRDGTLSLFSTVLDHSWVLRGSVPTTPFTQPDGGASLAAISRELSFNDPQADNGEDGHSNARGVPIDRNVELLIKNPLSQ